MTAFVAAASSVARSMAVAAATSSAGHDLSSFGSLKGRHSLQLETGFKVSSGLRTWQGWIEDGGGGCCSCRLTIVARAGGSRPPPGARRPRPNNRQQSSNDEDSSRDRTPVNEEITASTVMLIGEDGKLIGTISRGEALDRAQELDMDLVQLDNQNPPCVKILQYSKFKYELQKRKREQQKKSIANRVDLKELKMRYNIDTHDYAVRLKAAQRFLRDGDKVKLIIQFKGREAEFKDLGVKLFERFEQDLVEDAVVESKLTKDGRNMSMVFAPSKGKNADKQKTEEDAGAVAVGAEA